MFSHIFIGVSDFDRALTFYSPVMQALGLQQRFLDPSVPWAGWHSEGGTRPYFLISKPFDGNPHHSGNGQMTAFAAQSRATVHAAYAAALAHGGQCDGPPGLRPHYHPNYFGAYFRDPEGNKLCVASHEAEPESQPSGSTQKAGAR